MSPKFSNDMPGATANFHIKNRNRSCFFYEYIFCLFLIKYTKQSQLAVILKGLVEVIIFHIRKASYNPEACILHDL